MGAMSGKKIIVAVDGSDTARDALRYALQMAPDLGCSVTAIIAIQTRIPGYRAGYFSFVDRHVLIELRSRAGCNGSGDGSFGRGQGNLRTDRGLYRRYPRSGFSRHGLVRARREGKIDPWIYNTAFDS
jgi:nucleotide-binding universal stress UspA family protein